MNDLRYALRQLRRNPGFTAAVVLTLALGIGANATLFGMLDRVLLRPFPGIQDVDRVVEVASRSVSHPGYRDFREAVEGTVFSGLAGYRNRTFSVGDGTGAELATGLIVSGNYFQVLGARAELGRLLTDADDSPEAPLVAVVSHGYWRRALGGDPRVVGRELTVNDRRVTVVGVAAPDVRGTRVLYLPDLWVPMASWPALAPSGLASFGLERRTWSWITLVGRLAPGVTRERAEAALDASAARQRELHPTETPTDYTLELTPLVEAATGLHERGAVVGFFTVLAGVVGLVLLIACANVASLLIARAANRERELGVRAALGASRGRLMRQLLGEAAVLAALGTVAALALARLAVAGLHGLTLPGDIALTALDVGVDLRVIAFATGLGALACLAFGLFPAWHAARRRLVPMLHVDARARYRVRAALLAGQVALCLVLLVATGLFVRSLQNAMEGDPGFRTEDLMFAGVNLGLARYDEDDGRRFYAEVSRRVAALPGVAGATWAVTPPLSTGGYSESFEAEGYEPAPDERLEVQMNAVAPEYFRVMDIPLVRGRGIERGDRADAPLVAVINETMATRYFRDGDPVGRRLGLVGRDAVVVGVAGDTWHGRIGEAPEPHVYLPLAQVMEVAGLGEAILIAHVPGGDMATLPAIRGVISQVDAAVPVFGLADIGDLYADVLLPQRLGAGILAAFGALALTLAVVGVFGVVQFVVAQRTREIGIRMALGAEPRSVVGLALRGALAAVGVGIAIGAGLAAVTTGAASQFFVGVGSTDAVTYGAAAALLTLVSLAAAYAPARRAARVDPTEALRAE